MRSSRRLQRPNDSTTPARYGWPVAICASIRRPSALRSLHDISKLRASERGPIPPGVATKPARAKIFDTIQHPPGVTVKSCSTANDASTRLNPIASRGQHPAQLITTSDALTRSSRSSEKLCATVMSVFSRLAAQEVTRDQTVLLRG